MPFTSLKDTRRNSTSFSSPCRPCPEPARCGRLALSPDARTHATKTQDIPFKQAPFHQGSMRSSVRAACTWVRHENCISSIADSTSESRRNATLPPRCQEGIAPCVIACASEIKQAPISVWTISGTEKAKTVTSNECAVRNLFAYLRAEVRGPLLYLDMQCFAPAR